MAAINVREGNDVRAEDMMTPPEAPSEIAAFFEGSTLFITGATGFLGNVLVEKLLRTCSGIRKVYLLLRSKKGKDSEKRFEEIFSDVVFNRLHQEQPDFLEKLSIVNGDMDSPNLGISEEDVQKLIAEVDVVFHVAATVKFDEMIRKAVAINVKGTKEILQIAKRMKRIRAIVHVSTAYSNCPRKDIDELFYDPTVSGDKLIAIVDTLDDEQLELITPKLLGEWPNTYVFTKAIAENIIKEYGKGMPVAMVRPSIVIATAREPVPGWINNLYGATGIAMGAAVGLLRTLHCHPNNVADLVPVDYVVNAMIAAAWNIGSTRSDNLNEETSEAEKSLEEATEEGDVPIYNYVGSTQAPISWLEFMRLTEVHACKIPSPLTVWHYCFRLNSSWHLHMLCVYLLHFLPGIIVDAACIVMGKKPMLLKGYKKINKFAAVISYFSSRQWKFHNSNTQLLWKRLASTDQKLFEFDMSQLNWDEYFYSYVRGMRVYLLKDPLDTIPQGKIKFYKLKVAHYVLVSLLWLGLIKLCFTLFSLLFG